MHNLLLTTLALVCLFVAGCDGWSNDEEDKVGEHFEGQDEVRFET